MAPTKCILKQISCDPKAALEQLKCHRRNNPEQHWKDIKYDCGDTILHIAARLGHVEICRFLLENYTKAVDCRNNDNKTPLHEAAQFSQAEIARLLVDSSADINALKKADWTPLMLACTKLCDVETCRVLLERGALVNVANKDGWTALHLASREGNVEILRLLVEHGLDVTKRSHNGRSALHVAALHGNLAVLNELKLCDVNVRDNCGNTPLHEAVLSSSFQTFDYIVGIGGCTSATNNLGYTILHLAASVGALDLIRAILQRKLVGIDSVATNGVTALHCAARKNFKGAFEALIESGANPALKDSHARTANEYLNL